MKLWKKDIGGVLRNHLDGMELKTHFQVNGLLKDIKMMK